MDGVFSSEGMPERRGMVELEAVDTALSYGCNHVLVVAIDEYEKDPLHNCVSDAQKLVKVLTSRYRSFEEDRVIFLKNKNATRSNIINKLRQLATTIQEGDNLLIYYAGHGAMDPLDEEGFWWTAECNAENFVVEGLPNQELIRCIKQIKKARHILLIVDACFSGTVFTTRSNDGKLIKNEFIRSRWAITSGGKKESVEEGMPGKGSPFN